MVNEPRLLGGHGPPRRCHQNDGIKDFHDGGGLCSPGRWRPLHAWSSAIQGKAGQLIRVLMRWLADKLDMGERLQRPVTLYAGLPSLSFFTDAKLRLSLIGPG